MRILSTILSRTMASKSSRTPGTIPRATKMKIAFIGLGIMGLPMAENLAKKYPLIGYDIVAKTTPFPFAHSYQEALEGADVVFTMLPKSEHVLMAYREIRNYLKPGMIAVDMSTIAPKASLA